MGQAQHQTEQRRAIRRVVGTDTLAALDKVGDETAALRTELRVQIGRLHLVLGKTTDADLGRPMMFRLDVLEACSNAQARNIEAIRDAHLALATQQAAINRSFWTRLKWLLWNR